MKIFVFKNGQKTGPFSLEEVQTNVRAGLFVASDLCWYESLANWTPLSVLPATAPTTTDTGSEPPPIALVPPRAPEPPPPPPVAEPTAKKPSEAIGMILVMLPAVSAILTWFWIGNMRLIDGPGAKLGGLSALTALFTSALAAFEASELGFGKDKTRPQLERVSPLGWFFSMVLIWIIDYPRYLYARSRYGVRNLVGFGLLSMILWLVPLTIVSYHIITAESDLQQRIDQLDRQ